MKEFAEKLRKSACCGGKANVHDNIGARKYMAASGMAVLPDEFFSWVKYVNGVKTDFAKVYAIDPQGESGFTDAVHQNEFLNRPDMATVAVIGEDSFDYLVYDAQNRQYQMRDKSDDEILTCFSTLKEALQFLLKR